MASLWNNSQNPLRNGEATHLSPEDRLRLTQETAHRMSEPLALEGGSLSGSVSDFLRELHQTWITLPGEPIPDHPGESFPSYPAQLLNVFEFADAWHSANGAHARQVLDNMRAQAKVDSSEEEPASSAE